MNSITINDITPDKSELRLLVESFSESEFYIKNKRQIYDELGLIEIHELDSKLLILRNSNIISNTNNGNSYISYLIGLTTVVPSGKLLTEGGSLPD